MMIGQIRGCRGIALVLVLWVITLLTVMALGLTAAQRTETALTLNALDGARFRAAAEAGVSYAVLNLLASRNLDPDVLQADPQGPSSAWLPDGSAHRWTFSEVPLAISVQNEASRINLNLADANLLTALFMVLNVPEADALALADRILDWRDPDDLNGLNGAEDPDYAAAGLPYGAKDGPFDSVEELRQVLGVTQDLYALLAPEVTVDTGESRPAEQFASAVVLAALNGLTLEDAQLSVAERNQPPLPGAAPRGVGGGGPLYRIRVARAAAGTDQAMGADPETVPASAGLAMEALVRVEPGTSPPVSVMWRRYGLVAQPGPAL